MSLAARLLHGGLPGSPQASTPVHPSQFGRVERHCDLFDFMPG